MFVLEKLKKFVPRCYTLRKLYSHHLASSHHIHYQIYKLKCTLNRQPPELMRNINPLFYISRILCHNIEGHEEEAFLKDSDYQNILKEVSHPHLGHRVLVVQPKIKWGPKVNRLTKPEYQLAEAITLTETLQNFKAVGQCIIPVQNTASKLIFGSGNLEKLKNEVKKSGASALLIGVNMLTGLQHQALEEEFQLSVFDRYTIVLRIFSDHARTREAKLQVSLAEIPYIRSRLRNLHTKGSNREGGGMEFIGGAGESYMERRKKILMDRELKLRSFLKKIKERRSLLRESRQKLELPTVAIVGYTNSGKTSLIKVLTEDSGLEPKDQLFATLDVTAHLGKLPSVQKVIFMDTVGFISDIPTTLVESFSSTLEDIALCDLIVHIRDLHHPDTEAQKQTVLKTLKELNISEKLLGTIVEVGNKVDLLDKIPPKTESCYCISATSGFGVGDLMLEIETRLMQNAGLINCTVRIPMGGEETSWLYKLAAIKHSWADPDDAQFLFVNVTLTPANYARFKHHYGNLFVQNN